MSPIATDQVWNRLTLPEQQRIIQQIVVILTEELEHERIDESQHQPFESPRDRISSSEHDEAGREKPRECPQPASLENPVVGVGVEAGTSQHPGG